ncbi:hypothetical protein PtA15_9A575 [Puccinia triticina]|uniref:Uncharacterized protein n=1 Tax=Puccinia triticina TaxID=208348 RepID=A0ABY7CT46_9BASI|nr:uncharacterized protein PtA15_9A575 [Puccinia triticina]WAQ88448.1 hypothetical protein PtA15_9A575 [Puccinia triticina]WAR60626.1 hypothetical protein PtB15_9B565 [Puccinia triticina]
MNGINFLRCLPLLAHVFHDWASAKPGMLAKFEKMVIKGDSSASQCHESEGFLSMLTQKKKDQEEELLKTWLERIYDPDYAQLFLVGDFAALDFSEPPELFRKCAKHHMMEPIRKMIKQFNIDKITAADRIKTYELCELIDAAITRRGSFFLSQDNFGLAMLAICTKALAEVANAKLPHSDRILNELQVKWKWIQPEDYSNSSEKPAQARKVDILSNALADLCGFKFNGQR